ncbi:MAG: GDSL-type esterase/lipase family protein [Bryobacteraceae bacterium]
MILAGAFRRVLVAGLLVAGLVRAQDPARFETQIRAFLEKDEASPPPKHAILFIGSSIFRQWTMLTEQMTPLPVFNRAFGGSQTPDILYYMDKVVLPYEPRIVVYYCGSNDVNAGRDADAIAANFRTFAERVHAALPETRIFYVSINRAPDKRKRWDVVDSANAQVREYCKRSARMGFVDVNPALFGPDGEPRMELYLPDKLHFKAPAYVEFTAIVKPVLERAWNER